jgi:hypothetical protein
MARGAGRISAVGGLVAVAVVLGGCGLLFPPTGFGDDLPSSSPIASYRTGTATIAIDGGAAIQLTELADGASIDSLYGSNVHWTGGDGWHVRLSGAGADDGGFGGLGGFGGFGASGLITLDRIADGKHLTTYDNDSRCIVDIDVADKTALRGKATCKGLESYDALDLGGFSPDGPKDLDLPKFDAELTFEAAP